LYRSKVNTIQLSAHRNRIWVIKEHLTPRMRSHGGDRSGYSHHKNRSGKSCQLWTFLFYVLPWNGPCVDKFWLFREKRPCECAVHPLLQSREVCEKELIRIENDSLAGCEKGTSETKTVNFIKFVGNFFFIKMDLVILFYL